MFDLSPGIILLFCVGVFNLFFFFLFFFFFFAFPPFFFLLFFFFFFPFPLFSSLFHFFFFFPFPLFSSLFLLFYYCFSPCASLLLVFFISYFFSPCSSLLSSSAFRPLSFLPPWRLSFPLLHSFSTFPPILALPVISSSEFLAPCAAFSLGGGFFPSSLPSLQ